MRMLSPLKLLLIVFVFGSAQHLFGQTGDINAARSRILADKKVSQVIFSKERATPSLIYFKSQASSYGTGEATVLLRHYLQLRAGYDDVVPVKQTRLPGDMEVPEYQQYFKGVKVEYSRYKGLAKSNRLALLAGSFYKIPETLSVLPALTEAQALQRAKEHVGARHYVYEDLQTALGKEQNPVVRRALEIELKETYPRGALTVVKDFTNEQAADMRLAYKFNLYASEPLSRGYVFVDAQTGKILLYNAIIKHASVPTTVTTRYAGNRTIHVKQVSGNDPNSGNLLQSSHPTTETYVPGAATYVLADDTRGNGIETYDLNGIGGAPISVGAIYAQGKSFTDVDNNWTLAEHKRGSGEQGANEAENDDIAWDAHWGAATVYDYWKNIQNRLSYDGNNAKIKSFIHYGPAYDNAFWNGSAMTYGDGSGEAAAGFKPLTSLDVCGHEIGHGVCSFTSDLVYASESGAMNEALSDIWAACVEHYVIKQIDPSLGAVYKPFFIGEQISANPLRRMDNPKLRTDPDTYGGQYWQNPNCTPTLANDQCGVHTNSGVLNKWFYLLSVGSGNGSGPDANYAIPGVDDGLRDNGAAYNTVPYSVTGVGIAVAERITYLTELLLSSTATFAEFRDVAIAVASAYSGDPCGPIVQSVTNAMFAVGVGSAFTTPCIATYGFTQQPGLTINEFTGMAGCDAEVIVYLPVLLPAGGSATVSLGGTATQGIDYTVNTTSLTNSTGSNKTDTIIVRIKNDAVIESQETIVFNLNITNTGTNPVHTGFTITINDDDVAPRIGADTITLLTDNFNSYPNGLNQPAGWTEIFDIPEANGTDQTAPGINQWGVFDGRLAIAPKLVGGTAGPAGTYNQLSESQSNIRPPQVDALGLSNIRIKFDYTVQGEVDPNGTNPEEFGLFDYMALVYSFDGTNFLEFGPGYYFAQATPVSGTFEATLPSFLNNQKFYLGFRWVNDALVGGAVAVIVDNLSIKASPKKIETRAGATGSEITGGNQEVYYYSLDSSNIIAKVVNASSFNYNCITATIEHAGNSVFELYNDADGSHKVSDKFIRMTPTLDNPVGSYDISLYLAEEEIAAIENATGKNRSTFFMYKTSAGNYTSATAGNTERVAAAYTAIPGVGGVFTAPFSTGFSGFAVGTNLPGPLPVTCVDLKATRHGNTVVLNWKVALEQNNRQFTIERSVDGVHFEQVGTLASNNASNGQYSFTDNAAGTVQGYYRLRQTDADGTYRYICNTLLVKGAVSNITFSHIYPNPVRGAAFVKVGAVQNLRMRIDVVNAMGQLVNSHLHTLQQGNNVVNIFLPNLGSGNYMVRFKDAGGRLLHSQSVIVR